MQQTQFEPIIESNLSKIFLFLLTLIFFVLASSINIKYVFAKFFKRKEIIQEKDISFDKDVENESHDVNTKQQSFLFKTKTEAINIKKNIFEIPSVKLLEKKSPSKNILEKISLKKIP